VIFYFSGTGNSYYAAKKIAEHNKIQLVSIPQKMRENKDSYEYSLQPGEVIGFVFPIYAWCPPKMVSEFIKKLAFTNYDNHYTFSVATCGANIGNAMAVLETQLKKKGLALHSGFSLVMPNNYMIMGDVDSPKKVEEKLAKAEERLQEINDIVAQRKTGVFRLEKGFMPRLLTGILNSLFEKGAIDTRRFYTTEACNGCGLCARVCITGNITVDGKPSWGANCTQCLACVNRCPVRAIQYGKGTVKKGRYYHPILDQ